MRKKWTDNQLVKAVASGCCMADVLRALNIVRSGNTMRLVRKHIDRLGLKTCHWVRPRRKAVRISDVPIADMFVINSEFSKESIRRRVKKENLLPYECFECELIEWRGSKISLQLDHINGNRRDNRLQNLRWLCPNCHSLTPTWGTKSRKKEDKYCVDCGCKISHRSTRCRICANRCFPNQTKIEWPPTSELVRMVKETSFVAVARKLGVSDNAVRKRIKNH